MSAYLLGIDPGNEQSAWALIDDRHKPLDYGKAPNGHVLDMLACLNSDHVVAIEMVASYGMPVGREVFETCVWVGRFWEALNRRHELTPTLVYRRDVKLALCGSARAKDANVRQALVDRFAPGAANHGKGTRAAPGWFYGFHSDIWQAYAVATTHLDAIHDERTTHGTPVHEPSHR